MEAMDHTASAGTARPASSTTRTRGLEDLASRYRGFLLDQWGVLHDGERAYPGAIETISRLHARGARILLLSNTAKPEADNVAMLARMGFATELYEGIVTAGDDARDAVARDPDPFYRQLGPRCLPLTRPSERSLASCDGFKLVESVENADWLFLLSMEPPRESVATWRPLLEQAAARRLPMVCGNPDLHRVSLTRGLLEAPGLVAASYEAMGREVRLHGKPQPRIYRTALARLGIPGEQVLAIGDSLLHDIRGAISAGLDCAWIAGGVHADRLGDRHGEGWPEADRCEALYEESGVRPTYLLPVWRW